MTIGEDRVRVQFNPSLQGDVDQIKQQTADLINRCESLRAQEGQPAISGEKARLIALAQTSYEEAAMWAVKAATAEAK